MGNDDPQARENLSRLALSCSALARGGQLLGTVTDPEKALDALRQAVAVLDSNIRGARLPQVEAAAAECRAALETGDPSERVASCRRLATNLARLASSLATEVQEQTRRAAKGAAEPRPSAAVPASVTDTPAPLRGPVSKEPTPSAPSAPREPAPAPVQPRVKPTEERRPAKPSIDISPVRVAVTAEERAAVSAALEAGERFAAVANGTVIDTRMDLMWAAKVGRAGSHAVAQAFAGSCGVGGYSDWRLPRPDEVQHFLVGGGREFGLSRGMFQEGSVGGSASGLWTSESSRRWLILRQATVVEITNATMMSVSATARGVHVLVVRSAVGRR